MSPLLKAKVLGQVGKQAILLVGGKTLSIKSDQSLLEGAKVQGRFSKVNGQFELTQVSSSSLSTGKNHLSTYFQSQGIASTELNFLIGSKLMEMGKALDPSIFSDMNRFSHLMGDKNELSVEAMLLAMQRNLPMSKGILSLLAQFLPFGSFKKLISNDSYEKLNDDQLRKLRALLPELKNRGINIKQFLADIGIDEEILLQKNVFESDILRELELRDEKSLSKLLKDLFSFYKVLAEKKEDSLDLFLQIPFIVDDEIEDLSLRYKQESSQEGEEGTRHSLELLLDLSNLGKTYLQFTLSQQNLSVLLKLENLPDDIDVLELEDEFLSIDGVETVQVKMISGFVESITSSKKKVEVVRLDIKA